MSRTAAAFAVVAGLALACAHGRRNERSTFTFPSAFDANQTVTVWVDGRARDLLASLRWRGGDLDVTLFDTAFAAPLLTVSRRSGKVAIETFQHGAGDQEARRLVELLVELYALPFRETAPGWAEARSGGFTFRLERLHDRAQCVFPDAIEIFLRVGPAIRVRVVTVDVSCQGEERLDPAANLDRVDPLRP